jgi:hypothetical protein
MPVERDDKRPSRGTGSTTSVCFTPARAGQAPGAHPGYFCPSPRKVPNADFRPELSTKHAFCSKCPRRSAAERRILARFTTDPTGEMSKVTARRLIETMINAY